MHNNTNTAISNQSKTQLTGIPMLDSEKFTLLLEVDKNELADDISSLKKYAVEEGFDEKENLHITVIGFKNGQMIKERIAAFKDGGADAIINKIHEIINTTDWEFTLNAHQYRISRLYMNEPLSSGNFEVANVREAYIQTVSMSVISDFYTQLNKLLDLKLEAPFPHVTLFTKGDSNDTANMGIAINSEADFVKLNPRPIKEKGGTTYGVIMLPTRPQPDTIVAIFLLKTLGGVKYPGIENADIDILSDLPIGQTPESFEEKGIVLLDVGGSRLDHHGRNTTASQLVAEDLGISANPALAKILQYAERDDKHGTGTISEDPLDRTFGLSGLIAALNKALPANPAKVVEYVIPLLKAHYLEERKRVEDLPNEFKQKLHDETAQILKVRHKGKNTVVVFIESNSPSLTGWLRSSRGPKADVVVQRNEAGFVNITTRQVKRIDLRWTAALLRQAEVDAKKGRVTQLPEGYLMKPGRIDEAPEWYYDRATNSILNGSIIQRGVRATSVTFALIRELVISGLEVPIERRRVAGAPLPEVNGYFLEIRVPLEAAKAIRSMITKVPSGVRAFLPETYYIFLVNLGKYHNNDVPGLIDKIEKNLSDNGQFSISIDIRNFKFGVTQGNPKKSFYFEISKDGGVKEIETILAKIKAVIPGLPDHNFSPTLLVASITPNADERFVEADSAEVRRDAHVEFPVTKIRLTQVIESSQRISYKKRYEFTL